VLEHAAAQRSLCGRAPLLWVERIERCTQAQVEALLTQLDLGSLNLIGVTTENPWVSVPALLLERMRVVELCALAEDALLVVLRRALRDPRRGLGALELYAPDESLYQIARSAHGDARRALDLLEAAARLATAGGRSELLPDDVAQALDTTRAALARCAQRHAGLEHAFVAALRASDPDAALYWMVRMIRAGEAPSFVLHRMILFASEDIGTADPNALELAVTADRVLHRLGMPEALRSMGQCCVYLASAPKSDASYVALQRAERDAREHGALPTPSLNARDPLTSLLPEPLSQHKYYCPSDRGFEARVRERLEARKR
jgi:putative ATPase